MFTAKYGVCLPPSDDIELLRRIYKTAKQADRNFIVVCDDIGGASFGKEAAQIACEALKSFLMTEDEIYDVPEALLQAVRYANSEVIAFMTKRGGRTVGGTKLIAALIKNDMLYWISV